MKPMHTWSPILLAVLVAALPLTAHAVAITVDIGGTIVSGNDSVVLSNADGTGKPYGNIKVSGQGGQPARVIAGDGSAGGKDSTEDTLKLVNAVITPVTPFSTEYRIAFSGTFNDDPKTSTGPYWYKLQGVGNIRNTNIPPTVLNNTVRARGSLQVPAASGGWTQITGVDLSNTASSGNFNFFTSPSSLSQQFPAPDVNGPRVLKGEFWFTLKHAKDVITISATTGIPVMNSSAPGQGDDTFSIPQPKCNGTNSHHVVKQPCKGKGKAKD